MDWLEESDGCSGHDSMNMLSMYVQSGQHRHFH